jgi:hypothetical protein
VTVVCLPSEDGGSGDEVFVEVAMPEVAVLKGGLWKGGLL